MAKRIIILLSLITVGLLLLTPFVIAQGSEDTDFVWMKNNELFPPTENAKFREYTNLTQAYPYYSYDSGSFFFPPYQSENDRIGYGKVENYDTTILVPGWYTDWSANINPSHPAGAEYVRTIYLNINNTGTTCSGTNYPHALPATQASQVTPSLSGSTLTNNVNANPGALWLIGNEMDAPHNGNPIQAELYAELYHDLYTTIKATDPLARVAIGAIAQPSPVRREYLDKILNHYQTKYGETFPTDLWNIHLYNLNETECEWGLALPPFGSASLANHLSEDDFVAGELLNQTILQNNIRDFRQWMKDRGYQNTPLIITEYGSLSEPQYSPAYSDEKAAQYLSDTSAWFRGTTDASTGYPADGYRLVQMWNWFSTRADHFGGDLFESNGTLSVIGNTFQSETSGHYTPYADLYLIMDSYTQTNTIINVDSFIQNNGNITSDNIQLEISLIDENSGLVVGEVDAAQSGLARRYQGEPISLSHTWEITNAQTPTVPYRLTVSVSSNNDVDTSNNIFVDQFNWSPVVNMVISKTIFSTGNPFKFVTPITTVITTTIVNEGNSTSTPTTADIVINGEITEDDVYVPSLGQMEDYLITTTQYITSMIPLNIYVKLNLLDDNELNLGNTQLTTSLLYERIYLPLVLR